MCITHWVQFMYSICAATMWIEQKNGNKFMNYVDSMYIVSVLLARLSHAITCCIQKQTSTWSSSDHAEIVKIFCSIMRNTNKFNLKKKNRYCMNSILSMPTLFSTFQMFQCFSVIFIIIFCSCICTIVYSWILKRGTIQLQLVLIRQSLI